MATSAATDTPRSGRPTWTGWPPRGCRFTQYYAWCYCTPSRAALLTGRLPVRSGLNRVLGPKSTGGIPDGETTLAQALKATRLCDDVHRQVAPRTSFPGFLPTRHGFDHYFGIPYSNDMDRAKEGEPPIPLMRDEAIVEQPAVQETLTQAIHRGGPQVHPRPGRRGQAGPAVLPLSALHLPPRPAPRQRRVPGEEPARALRRRRRGARRQRGTDPQGPSRREAGRLDPGGLHQRQRALAGAEAQRRVRRAVPGGEGHELGRGRARAVPGLVARHDRARPRGPGPGQRARPVRHLRRAGRRSAPHRSTL